MKTRLKPHQKRLYWALGSVLLVCLAVLLILHGLRSSVIYFYTPADLQKTTVTPGTTIRLGGLVEQKSWKASTDGLDHTFVVSDGSGLVRTVRYHGLLPSLFREGQGVIAEGSLSPDGTLAATRVLARHDENYMPPEVAKALKERGVYKQGDK